MKPKLKIVCLGPATYVELDGKTLGPGVEKVEFQHDGNGDAKLKLYINLRNFTFMPDGYIDQIEKQAAEIKPPEDDLSGRTV